MPLQEHAFLYVECDIPQGQTVQTWRADRRAAAGSRRWLGRVLAKLSAA